jgi:hypothetical protein
MSSSLSFFMSLGRWVRTPRMSSSIDSLMEAVTEVSEKISAPSLGSAAQKELLLLGRLSGRQVLGEEVLKGLGNLVLSDFLDVFEGFLSSFEGLEGGELDHLGEALEVGNSLLDSLELSTSLVELLLLKEADPCRI